MTNDATNTEQSNVADDCPNERIVMLPHIEVYSDEWYAAGPASIPCENCVAYMMVDPDCPRCKGTGYIQKWVPIIKP